MPNDPPHDPWDPEEVQDFWEDLEDWYSQLRRIERNGPLDVAVLTPPELCERWQCNMATLERVLEDEDCPLLIEHSGLKGHMATYPELREMWHGADYSISFFSLKDAFFRVSDILTFEKDHPELITALKHKRRLKKPERSDASAHVRRNNVKKIILKIKGADTENIWSQRKLCKHPEIIEAYGREPSAGYINKIAKELAKELQRSGRKFKWLTPGRKPTSQSPASKKSRT